MKNLTHNNRGARNAEPLTSKIIFLSIIMIALLSSCKKFVQVPPPTTSLVSSNVYTTDASATSVLTGIYSTLNSSNIIANTPISLETGLESDELTLSYTQGQTFLNQLYSNSLTATSYPPDWQTFYNLVYATNAAIEGISGSSGISSAVKQQLLGEAEFLRAFFYFYLVNLYGNVPLITTTNYQTNQLAARAPQTQVYGQIVTDLKSAISLLNNNYLATDAETPTSERTIPNKATAMALLARVYLYTGDYTNAIQQSNAVIGDGTYSLDSNLNNVFLANSTEAIWQLQPNFSNWDTYEGYLYILTSTPNYASPVTLSNNLVNAFEPGDQRFTNWVGSYSNFYFPFKYKQKTAAGNPEPEYLMVFRLAEQYLIRAESEANTNDVTAAMQDLNVIRNRAGLADYSGQTDSSAIKKAILHERQVELFTEWGHRWMDLKRTGSVNATMSVVTPQKGGSWSSYKQLYPIPNQDILTDKNLTQNQGY